MKAISLPLFAAGGVKFVSIPAPNLPPFEVAFASVPAVSELQRAPKDC
jgi:hypothetical protein